MTSEAGPTTRSAAPLRQLGEQLAKRLRALGLVVSLWDSAGAPVVPPTPEGEYCCQFCGENGLCLERMGRLAQQVCLDGDQRIDRAPTQCLLLGVPVRRRRRLLGAAVACFPTCQDARSEEFGRACSAAGLDAELMASLSCRAARHGESEAEHLATTLQWLIQDEQAKQVARQELTTLSTNLANTYEELSLLYRISGSVKVNTSTTSFFENICAELMEVMQLQAVAAVLAPRDHSGQDEQIVCAGEPPVTTAQLGRIAQRYIYPRLGPGGRHLIENQFAEQAGHLGPAAQKIRTLIALPLTGTGPCKGLLLGINKIGGEFDSVDLKLISSISGQAAVFLENRHLYEDLQDLLLGMLHALTASIDAKDPYTCGHSRRVALASRKLAQLCGFDEHRTGRVYLAGLLHDIGKIGMPEAVLLKTGRLTDEEFADVKRHPQVGAGILGGIPQMGDLIPAVLYHHERPDGRGYPEGLAGRDVPIEALIVGLSDSFDAMTSSRTYRSAMPLEAVVTEIRRCSGTQFDSHLVELLLSLDLEEFLGELRRAADADARAFAGHAAALPDPER